MLNLDNLIVQSEHLSQEIQQLEEYIDQAPEGKLICRSSQGGYLYYHKSRLSNGTVKEKYLGKENTQEAISLAQKLVAVKRLPELKHEKNLIDQLIDLRTTDSAANKFLEKKTGIASLLTSHNSLSPFATPDKQDLEWKNQPYNRSQKHPEQLKYSTIVPGLFVRSKAEADIVSCLEHYNIPYHYEEEIVVNGNIIAMDFTCRNKFTHLPFYWDHRGMLDDPQYIDKTIYCEQQFLHAGIIPGINLIVTTETKNHPLDLQWVDLLARYYLM